MAMVTIRDQETQDEREALDEPDDITCTVRQGVLVDAGNGEECIGRRMPYFEVDVDGCGEYLYFTVRGARILRDELDKFLDEGEFYKEAQAAADEAYKNTIERLKAQRRR